jgi:hypothetical protein
MGVVASALLPGDFDWNQRREEAMNAVRAKDYARALAIDEELWAHAPGEVQMAAAAEDAGTVLHYQGEDREARA